MQSINVKLEAFEGPFDLLYHLIEKNEIDIYDIPISELTDQYITYLNAYGNKNMDGMSKFLVMAATLIEIKSKMLLPNPKVEAEEDNIDPRDELVLKLIEYKRFKSITEKFKESQEKASLLLFKEGDANISVFKKEEVQELEEFLDGISMSDIFKAFEEVMSRKELKIDKVRSSFKSVERDLYNIDDKINFIKDLLILTPKIRFSEIFRNDTRKMEVVVTFLALLELIKMKSVFVSQDSIFKEIIIMNYDGCEKNEINRA